MKLDAVRRAEYVTAENTKIVIHSNRIEVKALCAILALLGFGKVKYMFFYGILLLVKLFSGPTGNNISVKSTGYFSHSLCVSEFQNSVFGKPCILYAYALRFAVKQQKYIYPCSRVFVCAHYNLRTYGRTSQSRLSISFIELQPRAALATHHYTEDVFQSILHCYHIRGLLTQSGCTQCHRKSDRFVLGNCYTAISFRGMGLSIEDSSSLFHEEKDTIYIIEEDWKHVTHEVRQMATGFSVLFQGPFSAIIFFDEVSV